MSNIVEFIKNNRNYFENLITRLTYHSNSIEGNTLSYAETYAIIFNDNDFTLTAKPRELYEAINHKYALDYVFNNLADFSTELKENHIKKINSIINKNIQDGFGYRTVQVFIRGAEEIPPAPQFVPTQMMYLVHDYNNSEMDFYFKLADFHIRFEHIHPFEDGNGRTGRLLLNAELLANNKAPIVIPVEERSNYFNFIASYDVEGLANYFRALEKKENDLLVNSFGFF